MDPRLDDVAKLISGRPFEPHALLRGGHAQTVAGWAWPRPWRLKALRRATTMDEERLFEVEPGVRLLARCRWQEDRTSSPTLILVHGLGGSDTSPYVMGTAEAAYRAGMNVVRLTSRPGFWNSAENWAIASHPKTAQRRSTATRPTAPQPSGAKGLQLSVLMLGIETRA